MMKGRINKKLLLTVIVFGIIYSLISLVNHYNFRTYALDLGLCNNALYSYSHFHWNHSIVMQPTPENLLSADHFDIYLILFSPLVWIFGSYTLLVVQIISVLFGGIGIYKFFSWDDRRTSIALLAAIHFYLFFGIFSTLAFDYHSNVVAAMIVPWFFYFLRQKNYAVSALLFFLICIAKENMVLWMFFISLGLMIEYRKDKKSLRILTYFLIFSIVYFITVLGFVMPSLSDKSVFHSFAYSHLGNNFREVFVKCFVSPSEVLKLLFINQSGNPLADYYKTELYIFVLLSGGIFLLAKPSYLIMLIPVFFQKMLHDNPVVWSVASQYSIEFAPIVTIGVFAFLMEMKNAKWKNVLTCIVLILTLIITVRRMDHTEIYTDKSRIRIYKKSHYEKDYDVSKVYKALSDIPLNAAVSAQSPFVPHLAMREKIYQFPIIKDADYIVFSKEEQKYPLTEEQFSDTLKSISNSGKWQTVYENDGFEMLKRNKY